ncbi:MAG: NADH-quinone oxidoreductase subunit C, partial [Microvirga sp.]
MSADTTELETQVRAALGDAVRDSVMAYDELTILVDGARIVEVLTRLRDDPALRFVSFIDLCGADYPGRERRFDVVYHLLSPYKNRRIRIKVEAD